MDSLVHLVRSQDDSRPSSSVLQTTVAIALFVIGFVAMSAFNRHTFPLRKCNDTLALKLADYATRKDDFDTLLIGSSRIHRQLVPDLFAKRAAEQGYQRRAYNLGIGGMNGIETERILAEALQIAAGRLRWVIVDPGELGMKIHKKNVGSARVVAWHDVPGLLFAMRISWASESTWVGRLARISEHLQMAGLHFVNAGGAWRHMERFTKNDHDLRIRETNIIEGDGYISLSKQLQPGHPRFAESFRMHQEFLDEIPKYRKWAAEAQNECRRKPHAPTPAERDHILRITAMIRAAGAQPIFLVAPLDNPKQRYLLSMQQSGEIEVLADFLNPDRYSAYYDPELHFDSTHLNHDGAEQFTVELVDELFAPGKALAQEPARTTTR